MALFNNSGDNATEADTDFAKFQPADDTPFDDNIADWPPEDVREAGQCTDTIKECLDIFRETLSPELFFSNYILAEKHALRLSELSQGRANEDKVRNFCKLFIGKKSQFCYDFILRCYKANKLPSLEQEIVKYREELSEENLAYFNYYLALADFSDAAASVSSAASRPAPTPPPRGPGFFAILGALMGDAEPVSKKHSRSCDGDCANCPPHYGYRYGRWYYGRGHRHMCERGGNGGYTGRCYLD